MFSDGYVKKNISKNEGQPFIINTKGGFQIKLVYGGDKQYLWVIFVDDTNIYGINRENQEISKTIKTQGDTTNFIVEESVKNKVQQQTCSDGFSSEGEVGVKFSCKTLTNNESSTVKNNYCDQPLCKNSDFTQCCTFNQTCEEVSDDFCDISGMSGFKDDRNNLYCEGPTCQQYESGEKPHKDVFVCCKPNNLPTKAGVCNAVKAKKIGGKNGGMTYDLVNPTDSYSGKYSTRITGVTIDPWEKSKYLNLMDYATKEWKKKPSGGEFRKEGFELNNNGNIMLGETQSPIIGSWDTISTPIQTKLSNLSNNANINLNSEEKTTFLKQLLKQSGEHAYNNLNDKFKTKKTCEGWNVCPVGDGKKDTLKLNQYSFFDGHCLKHYQN